MARGPPLHDPQVKPQIRVIIINPFKLYNSSFTAAGRRGSDEAIERLYSAIRSIRTVQQTKGTIGWVIISINQNYITFNKCVLHLIQLPTQSLMDPNQPSAHQMGL